MGNAQACTCPSTLPVCLLCFHSPFPFGFLELTLFLPDICEARRGLSRHSTCSLQRGNVEEEEEEEEEEASEDWLGKNTRVVGMKQDDTSKNNVCCVFF